MMNDPKENNVVQIGISGVKFLVGKYFEFFALNKLD